MENDQDTNNAGAAAGASDTSAGTPAQSNDTSSGAGSTATDAGAEQPGTGTTAESAESQPESPTAGTESSAAPQTQSQPVTDTTAQAPEPVVQETPPPPTVAAAEIPPPPTVAAAVIPPPPTVAAPAPVVQASATVQPSSLVGGITKYEDVNRILAGVPAHKLGIIHFLGEYITAMAPRRPIPEKQGAQFQANLFRHLTALMKNEEEHFQEIFTGVLKIFEKEASGVFAASHAFRFMDSVTLNKDESHAFCNLVDMIRLLGPVAGRKVAAAQIDLDKALSKGLTETARQRIRSFFGDTI